MKTAMILAAGRGERLKPLTDNTPKCMCAISGKPLIVYHIERLKNAGIEHIVVNHAWLGGKIRRCLGNGQSLGVSIAYSPEPPGGLETAGGIVQALPLLGDEPFLVVNADIYTDFDFSAMIDISYGALKRFVAVLMMIPKPVYYSKADFGVDFENRLSNHNKLYTIGGVSAYKPEMFHNAAFGRYPLAPLWRELADQQKIQAVIYDGLWIDIGSHERLEMARAALV